jgi:peptidoglycan/xylan/chitin deacetylase (PgdA/CDA1 family)
MSILTIDDAPSHRFAEKLAWLTRENIPAIFFIWGEKVAGEEALLVQALRSGFPLANHSWTHPHFSDLDEKAAREEIEKTEATLERLYGEAGMVWDRKYFRFPYFDRGGDPDREAAFQGILADRGYVSADRSLVRRDTLCDFDQKEYWLGNAAAPEGLDRAETILARIGPGRPSADAVILIHDHECSHDLFFTCIEKYRQLGVEFTRP